MEKQYQKSKKSKISKNEKSNKNNSSSTDSIKINSNEYNLNEKKKHKSNSRNINNISPVLITKSIKSSKQEIDNYESNEIIKLNEKILNEKKSNENDCKDEIEFCFKLIHLNCFDIDFWIKDRESKNNNVWPFSNYPRTLKSNINDIVISTFHLYPPRTSPPIHNFIIDKKFYGQTSQGLVFYLKNDLMKDNQYIVMKITPINDINTEPWIFNKNKSKIIPISYSPTVIRDKKVEYVSPSFLEAYCYGTFSTLVEMNILPHFPIIYKTQLSKVQKYDVLLIPTMQKINQFRILKEETKNPRIEKRSFNPKYFQNSNDNNNKRKLNEQIEKNEGDCKFHQIIFMENLPKSLFETLNREKNHEIWWSCLSQIVFTLCYLQNKFGFIHNDLHSENIRIRNVSKNTFLYYKLDNERYCKVPTFGNIITIIDFGRCIINYDDKVLVSSEFSKYGQCQGSVFYNLSIDLIRLIITLENYLKVIENKKESKELSDWFLLLVKNDQNVNILSKDFAYSKLPTVMQQFSDTFPRDHCSDALPKDHLNLFYNKFKINKKDIPENQIIYNIFK
jgi:hypothetical protein